MASINATIAAGGSFLLPVFALGRMQEILSVFHDARRFGRLTEAERFKRHSLGLSGLQFGDGRGSPGRKG